MPNTNCLEGVRCPKCQNEDAFRIEAKIMVFVTDEGTEDENGAYEWDEESNCNCVQCDYTDRLGNFTTKEEPNAA